MRRKLMISALVGAVVIIGILSHFASSGRSNVKFGLPGDGKPVVEQLPITQIVLFNSGVGYVQREGTVDGDADIDLFFNTTDINDLLKSMILEDLGGGKVSVISYDSSDPVDKILRSFSLDLTSNPTFGELLNQARGEKIEATLKATSNSPQAQQKGTIVGMEVRKTQVEKVGTCIEVDYLNLHADNGFKSIPLNQIEQVRFLNPTMEKEFQQALQVLASSHDVQKKRVTLSFKGAGKRQVRLGYVVEKPIWKMTYRLRMEPKDKLYLQGWALVENTSDNDWNNVTMTLVSGKPISYKMDLYEPLYIPRPTVEPDLFASLRPPLYDTTLDPTKQPAGPAPGNQPMPGQIGGFQGPQLGFNFQGGGFNFGGFNNQGMQGGNIGNFYQNQLALQKQQQILEQQGQKKLSYEELQKRKEDLQQAKQKAAEVGEKVIGLNFKEGIQSVATAEDIGDYFQYRLDQKVSLGRKRSAMLPVFNSTIDGQKVSIYNRDVHKRFPLLGLRFKNTSTSPLTQGPVTVYDENNYAGDTRILDVQPNEERLLSYAMDLGSKVFVSYKTIPGPKMTFKIGTDQLTAAYTNQRTTKYQVKNDSKHDRQVILEHPVSSGWDLKEPAKPSEKTPNHYRFVVDAVKGKSLTFEVVEEEQRIDPVALATGGKAGPIYPVSSGIEVKPVTKTSPTELVDVKIDKGQLQVRTKVTESKAYFIQNTSKQDYAFTVDHLIRPDWKLIDAKGKDVTGPEVYRFELEVKSGKTGIKEVKEEKVTLTKDKLVKDESINVLQMYIHSPAVSKEAKAALEKSVAAYEEKVNLQTKLGQLKQDLKQLMDDQDRLRENLKIIPPNADPYKQFLNKFVKQETQIEEMQQQVRDQQATLDKKTKEYDTYVKALTAN